jgi:hypothetical protein
MEKFNKNMKIVICGSMIFAKEMVASKNKLESLGHEVILPHNTELYASGTFVPETRKESTENKIKDDLIRGHFNTIKDSDAVLAMNFDKNGIKNYIGGNTLMEIGFAHVLNKKIFLLNPIPEIQYRDEIEAVQPIIINNNLDLII